MVSWPGRPRWGPIGVDIGSRSVKLVQLDADRSSIVEAARWDLPQDDAQPPERRDEAVVEALNQMRQGRSFHGRDVVLCLGGVDLFVQNIRVAQAAGTPLERLVQAEAAGRIPFPSDEAEIRYLDADDVRQGDAVRHEVILLACRRAIIERAVALAERAGLRPAAIDVEPAALVRCYGRQFRRDDDQQRRMMFVNVGASYTKVIVVRGMHPLFVKYVDAGGRHLDDAVARRLGMTPADASALRRHNGDRRADQRDPEVTRSIQESIRPVLDRLGNELSLCLRYQSVTFRGEPVSRCVVGGGEAFETLVEYLAARLDVPCELGNPLRSCQAGALPGRPGQWDVATGLALRDVKRS